ncbi:hypothetical protein OAR47_02070 [Gammaproteobacteria bacterium]|nr:hypothetical protein [Gammaproteobacteria bacterium]
MKKISNFIPDKVIKKKENIDQFNLLLKNNVNDNISSKIDVINYSDTSITIECSDSSISSIIKFDNMKYVQIFKDYGMYNIREIKVKLR